MPYLALVLNALVWGCSWWPLRTLQDLGLHALWASAATYLLGTVAIAMVSPTVLKEYAGNPALWLLGVAAGTTMVGFNWGVTIAEVIRVVLLFYLMPVWAALLARFVLDEPLTLRVVLRIGMALAGAALVLSPPGQIGFPWPSTLGEWLGLMGGAAFALNNTLLRHQQAASAQARLLGMFVGGVLVPAAVAMGLGLLPSGSVAAIPAPQWPGVSGLWVLLGFAASLLLANHGLQYGASRLPANVSAVVMLSEVVFATASAILFAGESLTLQVAAGGALILLAAGFSALDDSAGHT
ncbi:DMT family transporter [Limnobacter humi]|uniref:DMT family transporter n=1 Tax=Limnobacter humi TaxID=1778671 RepID=A0ABT1WD39_9BURK|nr:DMT family transporter [Limnobacter humi]MCQ8895435.1 DMT family transporter [Limnobacter humi]